MPIKTLLQDKSIWLAIASTLGIAFLSLIKTNELPVVHLSNIDKLFHGIAYFVLTMSWLLTFTKRHYKYYILLACIIYGIFIEVLQTVLTTYRTGDFIDILANTTGALLALLFFNLFFEKKQ
ncbi:VanZ family protein [Polaribacter sp. HL-MS24]|uniref:VanZ family protein n=1 Tax=Polaribacter sp. HL-MS24 TaxID=3077735 RepID=UPI002934F1BF|nr:VanZ family protein [Polaribacter sp. HL-MS24]WOC40973.1 VanZ family protein [Polaribacter sp. HL-MS24]